MAIGTQISSGSTGYRLDHCLFDLNVAADQYGQGLFRRSHTRLAQGVGLRRVDDAAVSGTNYDLVSSETLADPGGTTHFTQRNLRRIREQIKQMEEDARWDTFAVSGSGAWGFKHGEDQGGGNFTDMIHPSTDDMGGTPMFLRYIMLNAKIANDRGMGTTVELPKLSHVSTSGNSAVFNVTGLAGDPHDRWRRDRRSRLRG